MGCFAATLYKTNTHPAKGVSHYNFQSCRKGLDFMKQTAITLSKQASKQASKINYVLNPFCLQYLLSRDAV